MKWDDIPQMTRGANYCVDISWSYLESWLANQEESCPAGFELDPEFQRHHVWDDFKRQRYVEFILRGGRSSRDIYFNCANYMGSGPEGVMQLVDGKQRLEAVRKFLRDDLHIFNGLDALREEDRRAGFPGYKFSDFTQRLGMGGPGFKVHVNNLQTQAEVMQWYLDINEGGVIHTDDELARVRHMLRVEKGEAPRGSGVIGRDI